MWDRTLGYCSLIQKAADNTGLDPALLAALVFVESGGDQDAISNQGAVGLMQIMPNEATDFQCPNGPCFEDRPSTEELLDPSFNIEYGSNHLLGLVNEFGLRDGLFYYGPVGVGYEGYADIVLGYASMVK